MAHHLGAPTLCKGAAEHWDLDYLTLTDPEKVQQACDRCFACPALEWCAEMTDRLVEAQVPPIQVVQAGVIWDTHGQPTDRASFLTSARRQRTREMNKGLLKAS